MIGGRVGYHDWTELCHMAMFDMSWTEVSVLGSQLFGQALMESCDPLGSGNNVTLFISRTLPDYLSHICAACYKFLVGNLWK